MRVFLDANILFSASIPGSATHRLAKAVAVHGEAVTSTHAREEAYRNLAQKRPEQLQGFKNLFQFIHITHAFNRLVDVDVPQHDIPIIAGATGAKCTHLWTGDKKHFGKWYGKKIHQVTIVSNILLADLLMTNGWEPDA